MPDIETHPETPDADAVEQQQPVAEHEREIVPESPVGEADEGDVAEQLREVPVDEDDYR